MEIYCPVCKRRLTRYEALMIGYDRIGSAVVTHLVPKQMPMLGSPEFYKLFGKDAQEFPRDLNDTFIKIGASTARLPQKMRAFCSDAGYKTVEMYG